MNDTDTCRRDECATRNVTPNPQANRRTAEPHWSARRHDHGVDIQVHLPGVRREDLKLEVGGERLRLDATRADAGQRGRLLYGEPAPDAYVLGLKLDRRFDGAKAEAKLADGLLTLAVPLVADEQPRQIEVR